MSKKLKDFEIQADIKVWCSVMVRAASLEEAVEISKELGVTDFITVPGSHIDSELEINGILAQ